MKPLQIIMLTVAFFCTGCVRTGEPVADPRGIADENFNAAWDAANEVLRKYRFTIDRADRREGVITTYPMIGRHWFEFWRKDAITRRDVAEGSIQTVYRQVTVNIRRQDDSSQYLADVRVLVTRSNLTNPQVTSTSEAYELFLNPGIPRSASLSGLGEPSGSKSVPIGRDENLEQTLRNEINFLAARKSTIYPG
ncbi:MAG: outer membrane protein assembly factor BamC [Phycisphaerae bacterium]|nr:outer membrane protein assembly factor BamC [Phycisphaerae bacterium]